MDLMAQQKGDSESADRNFHVLKADSDDGCTAMKYTENHSIIQF